MDEGEKEAQTSKNEAMRNILTYPLVRYSEMNEELQTEVVELCVTACEKYSNNNELAAKLIKETLDQKAASGWHVVIGEGYGFEITHDIISLFTFTIVNVKSNCIWYGICEQKEPLKPHYCVYNGPPKQLSDEGYAILTHLCPEYASLTNSAPPALCCDKNQLEVFQNSSSLAYNLLRRCPSCYANFRLLFCAMTCDPDQANFIKSTSVVSDYITAIDYNITAQVGDTFFASCKDVTFSGGHAIDSFCGTSQCTRDLLLTNLGKDVGGHSPFQINFKVIPENSTLSSNAFDTTFYQCNQSVPKRAADPGGHACSCVDCSSSCSGSHDIPPQPSPPIEVLGIDVWLFGGFIVFVVLTLSFSAYQIITHVYSHENVWSRRNWNNRLNLSDNNDNLVNDRIDKSNFHLKPNCLSRLNNHIDLTMTNVFTTFGRRIAQYPITTLIICLILLIILSAGFIFIQVTTNPIELWSSKYSRSRIEKDYYDNNFVPFYRTEQLIIRPKNISNFTHFAMRHMSGNEKFGAALGKEFLLKIFDLLNLIKNINVIDSMNKSQTITLKDICFKPLEPNNYECAITSPLEYFQNNLTLFNLIQKDDFGLIEADYLNHLTYCFQSPLLVDGSPLDLTAGCLASSGIPVAPEIAFGAFNDSYYNGSIAAVLTILVNNNPDPKSEQVRKAEQWEAAFISTVNEWKMNNSKDIIISFQAERSVEDEIERQSQSDISTVAISYIVMFVYVSIFLGSYKSCRTVFVDLRITLGFGGVLIVLASVVASIGFWSYLHTPLTLIIVEVIPFLVLAVGVDNIFILVHDYEFDNDQHHHHHPSHHHHHSNLNHTNSKQNLTNNTNNGDSLNKIVENRIANCVGRIGPSILLTGLSESVAFFCGALTTMPAVRVFALYAGTAIVFNFLLQIFAFVALLTLDARRYAANRFDLFCCFKLRNQSEQLNSSNSMINSNPTGTTNQFISESSDSLSLNSGALDQQDIYEIDLTETNKEQNKFNSNQNKLESMPWLHYLVAKCLTPAILCGWLRPIILILSLGWICYAIAILPNGLQIGMDQKLSMPTDSYVLDYFETISTDLRTGPPVYFVVTHGHDYLSLNGQNQICGQMGCSNQSLMEKISEASTISNYTWITSAGSSWLDDFFDWIDPQGSPYCCRINSKTSELCPPEIDSPDCVGCNVELIDGRPNPENFTFYLPLFLSQNPSVRCPKGGRAAYHVGVKIQNKTTIGPSYFMTYHSVLKQPDDFIQALKAARYLANGITKLWHNNNDIQYDGPIKENVVFPYSVFYVFYEQYLTLLNEALIQLGGCLLAVGIVTLIFFGLDLIATFMVLIGVIYIVISLAATMVLWSVSLNALSLVNLVVAIGISVEFCAHIVRAFTISVKSTRLERSREALTNMGSSILRGITLTKLGGIIVLATSKSRLFQIFYFRMYLCMIIIGALTGLIVLPVFLSYFGPGLNLALLQRYNSNLKKTNDNIVRNDDDDEEEDDDNNSPSSSSFSSHPNVKQ